MSTAFEIKEMSGESLCAFYLTHGIIKTNLCPRNNDIDRVSEEVLISFDRYVKPYLCVAYIPYTAKNKEGIFHWRLKSSVLYKTQFDICFLRYMFRCAQRGQTFSLMTLDGNTFYATSADTIRHSTQVLIMWVAKAIQ
jgi:hypothetical protein